jgi:elongation factor Ts
MTTISAGMVKELRDKTGAGIMDCKQALAECDGDLEKAVDLLRKKGIATAQKRAGRATSEGIVQSYIHMGGKIGVLVEINCETDFVAKTDAFVEFAKNIAMHIAAANPVGISADDVPPEVVAKEKEIYRDQALGEGKNEKFLDKIVEGKLNKFLKESCLLNQSYVRNPDISITDYLNEVIGKTGEKITIRRFARFQIGDTAN